MQAAHTASHPRPRLFHSGEAFPSIHWALFHPGFAGPGIRRRIYDFELMYLIRGEMNAWFDDDASAPIPVHAGDLLLIPSATAYRLEMPTEPGVQLLGIHFDFYGEVPVSAEQDIVVQEHRAEPDRFGFLPVDSGGDPQFARYFAGIPVEIVGWMEEIVRRFAAEEAGFEMACRGLLLQVLASLLQLQRRAERLSHSQYRESLRLLASEMSENSGRAWSNAELAERLSVSEDYFIRLFREVIGVSPNQYIQSLRHKEAQRLLRDTSLKIEQVGRQCGYEDLHNFSHFFKKRQGISPREYRKLFQAL